MEVAEGAGLVPDIVERWFAAAKSMHNRLKLAPA